MDFQERLEALTHQLRPWSPLWSRSILQGWPGSGAAYPEDWLAYARSLDEAGERFRHGKPGARHISDHAKSSWVSSRVNPYLPRGGSA